MAENSDLFCRAVALYIQQELGIRIEYVTDIAWQEREQLFDQGKIQILWLCGLPYVHKADSGADLVELLAVPVPEGTRYAGLPIYFSDVVVRRDSRFEAFGDLRGSVWAYNEPRSHSGFNVVRAHLATRAEADGFFSAVVESGAHTTSVRWVLNGLVDGSAIDSTVLEWLITERPELKRQIRVLASLGPSPIPPWVISARVPEDLRARLRDILLDMERHNHGRSVLAQGRIARFVSARDSDYDPIRQMARTADQVSFA